ncbi:MAG: hypothetical protein U9N61_01695 [Euryarchaeota archaeon]|nr:hypothetical protein [Euryarchaeota archaeon]
MNRVEQRLAIIRPHFITQELVSKAVYEVLGEYALLLFDLRVLKTLATMREFFNCPIHLNNWWWGGNIDGRGFRDLKENTGSQTSTHRDGRALDPVVEGWLAKDVATKIQLHRDVFPHITRLETDKTWNHFDIKFTGAKEIICFK